MVKLIDAETQTQMANSSEDKVMVKICDKQMTIDKKDYRQTFTHRNGCKTLREWIIFI